MSQMDLIFFIGFGNTFKVVKDRNSTKEIQVRTKLVLMCTLRESLRESDRGG